MDKKKLERILGSDHAPDIDVNARKRAVNMAMAEFKSAQSEKTSNNSQGFSLLSRLMGKTNNQRGLNIMEQKTKQRFIYGGMATAMAVVLVGGLSLTQLQDAVKRNQTALETQVSLNAVDFGAVIQAASKDDVSSNPLSQWSNQDKKEGSQDEIVHVESDADVAPVYREAVKQKNDANLEATAKEENLTAPVPMEKPVVSLKAPEVVAEMEEAVADPLKQWRAESKKTVERTVIPEGNDVLADIAVATPSSQGAALTKAAPQVKGKAMSRAVQNSEMYHKPAPMPVVDSIVSMRHQGNDKFEGATLNTFKQVSSDPVSTFSSDVDTASYAFVRKRINSGQLPSPSQVRVEEMVNYFDYSYPVPSSRAKPFKPNITVMDSPWAEGRKLLHVGVKGYEVEKGELSSNLVFLLDVSGSMNQKDKLPLVKSSMKMLLDNLNPNDTISIVTYAGSTGVVLEPTKVSNRSTILNAMNNLRAGGGTAGAAGIELAYQQAEQNFNKNAVNRIILATDGDFNVGITNRDDLKRYIERKREKGIFLSVLGFGMGNYNDHMMQTLAQNGNGTANYIDSLKEAQKVLVDEATSALFPIAKDVKFQVEFNPNAVSEYRLIGYETRSLKREDFNNDKIDAGDIGAGHSVTAIYEFVPVGSAAVTVDGLRYGTKERKAAINDHFSTEYAHVKIRYKLPLESKSRLITKPVKFGDQLTEYSKFANKNRVQNDVMFGVAVSAYAQKLQGGQYMGDYSYDDIIRTAQGSKGSDPYGYRSEFINMVRMTESLSR